jgi:hypothetical protein
MNGVVVLHALCSLLLKHALLYVYQERDGEGGVGTACPDGSA